MLMANLYVGVSGLQTSQNAMNTTAHNLSNIGTNGYTRQQVSQGDMTYQTVSKEPAIGHSQTGLGVAYVTCKQVRSTFLDASYRLESGRNEFYNVSYNSLEEIEDQLQELNGAEFADSLTNLWTAVQELSKDPTNAVQQSALVARCSEFVESSKAVYKGLTDYQDNMNDTVADLVDEINDIGDKVLALNKQIVAIESGGVEHANDLRDTRNSLLDRLGELGNITYDEDTFGNVLVSFEGTQFILSDNVHHMGLDTDENASGYNTVYWEYAAKEVENADGTTSMDISGAHVFDLTQTVSTEMNTDVGELRSTLLARGDHNATYHDISDDTTGSYYNSKISQSIIMNVEAEFDQMFNEIVTAVNSVFQNAASNPATLARLKNPSSTDDPANYVMFNLTDASDTLTYDINSTHLAGTNLTGYTIANTQVNSLLLQTPTLNTFLTVDGEADSAAATALKAVFTDADYTLNPNVATKTDLLDYYDALVAQIANTGSVNKALSENQQVTVDTLGNAREQILGVSSDEELEFMIEYQNAYNAASRFINVVDAMLEHVVTSLGNG